MRRTDLLTGRFCRLLALLALAGTLSACDQRSSLQTDGIEIDARPIKADRYRDLRLIFNQYNYSWENIGAGVPPLILNEFPNDLHLIQSPERKKKLFFLSLLPMALMANEEISAQRRTLLTSFETYDSTGSLDDDLRRQIAAIQADYDVEGDPLRNLRTRHLLLRRVDTIPPAMILAQAANESGWGSSRFARHGNNLFGEWTFTQGSGLIPAKRPEGATYEVRRFNSLYQSIRSYTRNINTHWAYQPLRELREQMRAKGEPITGLRLAGELDLYSTRRDAYSQDIIALIRANQLEQLTTAQLLPTAEPAEATLAATFGLKSPRTPGDTASGQR